MYRDISMAAEKPNTATASLRIGITSSFNAIRKLITLYNTPYHRELTHFNTHLNVENKQILYKI